VNAGWAAPRRSLPTRQVLSAPHRRDVGRVGLADSTERAEVRAVPDVARKDRLSARWTVAPA
jgi:hypothetical protein